MAGKFSWKYNQEIISLLSRKVRLRGTSGE